MHLVVFASRLLALGGVVPKQVMEVREEQEEKAELPIHVTLSGMVMELRASQEEKADSPMLVTLFGIVTEVSP